MKNLPVQSLDYNQIKNNFKEFLKSNPHYKDFNFEGSGISTLLNIMSYNTHYLGFFVKMLLDESFVDSAHTRQALLSHAKRGSYVPRGRKSAQAQVRLEVHTTIAEEPPSHVINIERGTSFTSVNVQDDQRNFVILDGVILTDRYVNGTDVIYRSGTIDIHEGDIRTWKFIVDSSVVNQRFIIRDPNIDIDTIRVRVKPDENSTLSESFTLAQSMLDVEPGSQVFYVTTDETGQYQVFFGNDQFGVQPDNGNIIEVTYVTTNGPSGNGAKNFQFNAPTPGGADTNIGNFEDFVVETLSVSAGGLEPQTIDDLKFNIPVHYRRQNRTFTSEDFRSILLTEFRNIDSINVWGGEDHIQKDYGKVYVSIKPKFSQKLTSAAREEIRTDLIQKYGWVGIDVVFVDPEFITADVKVIAKVDKKKTNLTTQEIQNEILAAVQTYNTQNLSRFDRILSDVDLLNYIMDDRDYITTAYTQKLIRKTKQQLHGSDAINYVYFGNPLVKETVKSADITYGTTRVWLQDDEHGNLFLRDAAGTLNIPSGKVNYETGQIDYRIPSAAKISGYESSFFGILEFQATPKVPDVYTNLNNIVQIGKIAVSVS